MNILLYITSFDKQYISGLRGVFDGHKVYPKIGHGSLLAVAVEAKAKGCKHVITSDQKLLQELVEREGWKGQAKASLDNFQGSLFHYKDLEILITNPLKQIFSVNEGLFIYKRFVSKIIKPSQWFKTTEFTFEEVLPETVGVLYEKFKTAKYIAIDIETNRWTNTIDSVSYCGVWYSPEIGYTSHSIAFNVTDMFWVTWMRKFNTLPGEKIFQNGKFDNFFFFLYNALPTNWLWDTINMFHSWYSELPKDLAFQSAFLVRDFFNWKFESGLGKEARLKYNAKDTWATAMAFLGAVSEAPDWALNNYVMEFPVVPACLYCELQGIRANKDKLQEVKQKQEKLAEANLDSLRVMTNTPAFNPRSPKQVLKLMKILGHRDCENTNEKTLQTLAFKSPLTAVIVEKILEYRGVAKLISTYLVEEKLYKGRIFFTLNPHGTDTGRLASTEGALSFIDFRQVKSGEVKNIGLQIHNIPREGDTVKAYFEADVGFLWGEADYEQAEARDTAYLSGDEKLIEAVDGYRDFHAVNASAFFGVPYEEIVETTILEKDAITGKVLKAIHTVINKSLRDLAKRVNHGSNYNMGEAVLVVTMGLKNVFRAAKLLGLPKYWKALDITGHLLGVFASTYVVVKGAWYKKVISDVLNHRKLVGPTGWTRYCFGRPDKNKRDLNSYVAHPPQSLNGMTLNKAFKKVFYTVLPKHHENLRIKAQIHDSILFQCRIGHEYLAEIVKETMEFPVPVTDTFGKTRDLLVPADVKFGKKFWGELK